MFTTYGLTQKRTITINLKNNLLPVCTKAEGTSVKHTYEYFTFVRNTSNRMGFAKNNFNPAYPERKSF